MFFDRAVPKEGVLHGGAVTVDSPGFGQGSYVWYNAAGRLTLAAAASV
jgi:hypothetical protein